ncbi:hypothetical protein GF324_06535 [bacterium]|nr:hypothetical protein [bacterium]
MTISRFTLLLLLLTAALWAVTGCDDDDNPAGDDDHSEHLHAVGTMLIAHDDTLAMVYAETVNENGTYLGDEIEIDEGATSHEIAVWFLNDEGEWYRPDEHDAEHHTLLITTNELMLETDIDTQNWSFTMTGVEHGETELVVKVEHEGHVDYQAAAIPVHVHEAHGTHGPPVGMILRQGDTEIARANANNTVNGVVEVEPGAGSGNLTAWFFDANGVEFQPEDDHYLEVNVADESVVTARVGSEVPGNSSLWVLDFQSVGSGETTFTVHIMHDGHSHYDSPEIEVHVLE